jgi:hypothetical protein
MRRRRAGYTHEDEDEDEDPNWRPSDDSQSDDLDVVIVAMGKFIKDTGKHLWRRMSRDSQKKKNNEERKDSSEGEVDCEKAKTSGEDGVREVVFIEGEEGLQVQFPQDLSQTETVGRGYAWRTVSIIAKPKDASEEGENEGAPT